MNEKEKEEYLAYVLSRKSSNKKNYYKESLQEIKAFQKEHPDRKPSILLHVCCIVCACWPLDFLKENGFDVTVMYNNSNIWPKEEHDHRLSEVQRYLKERWKEEIPLIVAPYDYKTYSEKVIPNRPNDPEGWRSCFGCYTERMNAAFAYADSHGFDYFTTVMTFSRQKDSQKINAIGLNLGKQYSHTKYFVSDFKKANGALKSEKICDDYCIYRQDYCGCETSYHERHPEDSAE
jgi:predicted adenine nucleotide alpha hydrolase (AANH) superfamily ATPase